MDRELVSIIMGSDSDLEVMKSAAEMLELMGITFEIEVISAHRTLEKLINYIPEAEKRGIEVVIAGAGGAAHLPGVIAALTNLPVIGVPIKSNFQDGLDSLLSIVQMPAGVPVATVGVNNAKNAALLACRILSLKYPQISKKLYEYREKMKQEVYKKSEELKQKGYKNYKKA